MRFAKKKPIVYLKPQRSNNALKMMQMMQSQSSKGVVATRKKYRDESSKQTYNLMHDPRVVRGSTYAATVHVVNNFQSNSVPSRSGTAMSKHSDKLRTQRSQRSFRSEAMTPPPVDGRVHSSIQTQEYLEELTDRPVEYDMSTQTDPQKDRPVSPLFVPRLSGESKSTQVEIGELFDFDLEVEPILEVLVGKTLVSSLTAVCEEEEEKTIQKHRKSFEKRRDAELSVVKSMEAAERRRFAEKDRRMQQALQRENEERIKQRRLLAQTVAKEFQFALEKKVFANLEKSGHFYDPVEKEVTEKFLPALLNQVSRILSERQGFESMVDSLLHTAIRVGFENVEKEMKRKAEEEQERLRKEAEEAERLRLKKEQEEKEKKEAEAKRAAEEAAAAAEEEQGSDD